MLEDLQILGEDRGDVLVLAKDSNRTIMELSELVAVHQRT
jgi:hypothetical protein